MLEYCFRLQMSFMAKLWLNWGVFWAVLEENIDFLTFFHHFFIIIIFFFKVFCSRINFYTQQITTIKIFKNQQNINVFRRFFLISRRNGSKSFLSTVKHFFFNVDLLSLYHLQNTFLLIKLELVIIYFINSFWNIGSVIF